MYEKISTKDMSREKWLILRKSGIGGSDAGAVCGLNPYSSPMKVFKQKTCDEIEEISSEAIRIGQDLEDYVAQRFSQATGLKVHRSNYMYRSIENPFMIADVDRLVIGEDAGLECKTVSAYGSDKWKDDDIPLHYVMQCYHYMAVTGKRTWYIAAVILGQKFVYRKLTWDDALITSLIQVEKEFWNNHIMSGIMPSPDGSKASDDVINSLFQSANKGSAVKLVGFDDRLKRRDEIIKQIEVLQQEQNLIEQEVKYFMADNEYASNDQYLVKWSNVDTTRLDTKLIKAECPQIYRDYSRVTSSRRFQIKAA